ncbi:hypothetical protein EDD17DRAFT_1513192 [Pisolithus thermaeus]|nr:hypothetical protein EV401DRAFT_2201761 [Pisolithus croceorrhizus]KAI6152757.1 hypothetical protein EDD17DRAFT_1513192 [Pisolithus thermaeus]
MIRTNDTEPPDWYHLLMAVAIEDPVSVDRPLPTQTGNPSACHTDCHCRRTKGITVVPPLAMHPIQLAHPPETLAVKMPDYGARFQVFTEENNATSTRPYSATVFVRVFDFFLAFVSVPKKDGNEVGRSSAASASFDATHVLTDTRHSYTSVRTGAAVRNTTRIDVQANREGPLTKGVGVGIVVIESPGLYMERWAPHLRLSRTSNSNLLNKVLHYGHDEGQSPDRAHGLPGSALSKSRSTRGGFRGLEAIHYTGSSDQAVRANEGTVNDECIDGTAGNSSIIHGAGINCVLRRPIELGLTPLLLA